MLFQSASADRSALRTAHVDYLLRFVLERSATSEGGVAARLDALERTLVALTRVWRTDAPLAPAREVRLAGDTLETLLAWLEAGGAVDDAVVGRLGVYASGALTDGSVPSGWVRVHTSVRDL